MDAAVFEDEALWMSRVGGVRTTDDARGYAEPGRGGQPGHRSRSGMMLLVVVPLKEALAEPARILSGISDPTGGISKCGTGFRIRIVVGNMRAGMCFHDAEVGHEQSHGFRFHGRTTSGVDGQLAGPNELLTAH